MTFRMPFQVDYQDTDAMGIVHHASYLRWFERSRTEWLRSMNISYRDMEEEGYFLPLREATLKYRRTLKFDDHPYVEVSVLRIRQAGVDLEYKIVQDGEIVTTGTTSHVVCSRIAKPDGTIEWAPVRIPEKWRTLWLEQSEKKP
jgi:acyl-CoA thioester hydrolase